MMWTRIVGVLLVLVLITFAVQWMVPRNARRNKTGARQYLLWDVGPLVAFVSVVLLALSFVEAFRQNFVWAWGWGAVLGLVASVAVWLSVAHAWRVRSIATRRQPVWRVAWRVVRTFGPILIVSLVVLNVVTRWLGSIVEVFVAGAFGACVAVITLLLLVEAFRQNASVGMNEQRERNGK